MRVLVCIKRVPAPGARINVTADGQAVDTTNLGFTMSPHEECALEAGLRVVEAHGGDVTALTLGPDAAEEQLRYAASLGVASVVLLTTDGTEWDPQRTAAAIAGAVGELEEADCPFDVVVFGNESADAGGFQVGIRVARALGRPMITGAKGLAVVGSVARVQREIDGTQEVYELPLPAVVGVKEGINLPRYPTMKGRLASRKAVVESKAAAAPPGGLRMLRLTTPPEQESRLVVLGQGVDGVGALVDVIEERGLL
ncbi:MAG: electron transfer flavoprotein subunit beta/FixA family protein [Acidimicrobiia bacterium]